MLGPKGKEFMCINFLCVKLAVQIDFCQCGERHLAKKCAVCRMAWRSVANLPISKELELSNFESCVVKLRNKPYRHFLVVVCPGYIDVFHGA